MMAVRSVSKMTKKVIYKMELHTVDDQYPVHKTSIKLNLFLVKQEIPFGILIMTFNESMLQDELLAEWKY